MTLPILYTFRRCPYAIRARMGLVYAQQNVAIREVLLKNKPGSMLSLSPKGTVPVLQLEDGTVIDESYDIMVWALGLHNPSNIVLDDNDFFMSKLIEKNDGEFKYWLDRYKYFERHPEKNQLDYRDNAEKYIQELESLLRKNQFLFGQDPTIADIAIFPFIRQFAHVDKNWFFNTPYLNVQRWLNYWLESPVFKSVMKKYPLWQDDDINQSFHTLMEN